MGSPAVIVVFFLISINIALFYYHLSSRPFSHSPPQYGISPTRPEHRKFTSKAVEEFLLSMEPLIDDKDLYTLLKNCLPNTLDTTVEWFSDSELDPRTFLITGDIPAMWIRDSSNQIAPYIQFVNKDPKLKDLVYGVLQVQASFLDYDPYANAFLRPWYAPPVNNPPKGSTSDQVTPAYNPDIVWESKVYTTYVIADNNSSYIFKATGEMERILMSKDWMSAASRVFQVIKFQMEDSWPSADIVASDSNRVSLENGYSFKRYTDRPTETLGEGGLGGISKKCGLVRSAFRPSDDATTFPYLIPANAQLSAQLLRLSQNIRETESKAESIKDLADLAQDIGKKIKEAIMRHGVVYHRLFGQVFAYEVDCYGSHIIMDDANLPSLLSLPVLGFVNKKDKVYQNTRKMLLSPWNPWFFEGKFIQGIGSPHTGENMVWPMSLLIQIKTSTNESETRYVLDMIKQIAKNTNNLMCESVHSSYLDKYTRPWFSWVNGLAGDTIVEIFTKKIN